MHFESGDSPDLSLSRALLRAAIVSAISTCCEGIVAGSVCGRLKVQGGNRRSVTSCEGRLREIGVYSKVNIEQSESLFSEVSWYSLLKKIRFVLRFRESERAERCGAEKQSGQSRQ